MINARQALLLAWNLILWLLAGASLLLCALWIVMAVRSRYVAETFDWQVAQTRSSGDLIDLHVWSSSGGVGWYLTTYKGLRSSSSYGFHHSDQNVMKQYPYISGKPGAVAGWIGVGWDRTQTDNGEMTLDRNPPFKLFDRMVEYKLLFPYWLAAVICAVWPAFWAARASRSRRRRIRLRRGCCPHCGYDLRASPVRCPECGRPSPAGTP